MSPPTFVRSTTALARAELILLRRNSTIVAATVGAPLVMTAVTVVAARGEDSAGWAVSLALLLTVVLGMGVYMTSTLALVARRAELYLKRLRTTEAGDAAILTGILAPTILGGILQSIVAVGAVTVAGGAVVRSMLLLVPALLLGLVLTVLAAAATTGLVRGTEQADAATMPFFALFVLSGVWAAFDAGQSVAPLLLPGGALLGVVTSAVEGTPWFALSTASAGPGLAVLLGWCLVLLFAVRRTFRWEPRR